MRRSFQKAQYNSLVRYPNQDGSKKFDTHFDTLFCSQSRWRADNPNREFVNHNKLKMQGTLYLQRKTRLSQSESG